MQIKLLRAIQENEIRPVGGSKTIKVNVRLICATSQDLSKSVKEGTFRQELLFRLKVVTLKLPALRERREDILILANHFLIHFTQTMQKPLREFTREASNLLLKYVWPGNIRELENTIERCVALAESDMKLIHADLLPDEIRTAQQPQHSFTTNDMSLTEAVEKLERTLVVEALEKYSGNRTKTAESLGLSRRGLLNKIERYGLDS